MEVQLVALANPAEQLGLLQHGLLPKQNTQQN